MRKGRTIYHCHGKDKRKPLHTYKDVATAKRAHRAIMAKSTADMIAAGPSKKKRRKK